MRRRKIIKSIGAAAAVGGIGVGTASAGDSGATAGAAEIGVESELRTLLANGKIQEAKQLLERHDIAHSITQETLGGSQSPRVGRTGDDYDKSDVTAYCTLGRLDGDRYIVSGVCNYDNSEGDIGVWGRVDWCPDVCGITYNDSHWASPEPTRDNVNLTADPHSMQYKKYNANTGLAAEVNLDGSISRSNTVDGVAQIQTDLIWTGDNPDIGPKFSYRHTKAFEPSGSVKSISLSAGGIGVTLDLSSSEVWDYPLEAAGDVP